MARFDSIGLFWEDIQSSKRGERVEGPMPSIPETGWLPPTSFPNLDNAVVLALDTETFDPELKSKGPGWARGVGHIIGVSIAALHPDGSTAKWYFPFKHETMPEHNLDRAAVMRWLQHTLSDPKQDKIGANITYDIGWLQHEGIKVEGRLLDVQFAEALLDESARVSLDILGIKYLEEGKESNLLYEWLCNWFGGKPNEGQRKHMYRTPPCLAGPYAEADADLPLRLMPILYRHLEGEGLLAVFHMECGLIRLMLKMRFAGIRVDLDKAEIIQADLLKREERYTAELKRLVGFEVNVNASDSLSKAFDAIGLPYGRTKPSTTHPNGQPSFTKAFVESVEHPVADLIREIKKCSKLRGTFIESYILNSHVNGMVHGQFHQLRGDSGGTRSGRFSSSTPNLQNIPARDDELAPLIRGIFVPDIGHVGIRKYDYSQIEYRLLIHFSVGLAGREIRGYFARNPDTDYHVYAQALVKEKTGVFIERKPIKNINFGLIYGMGDATLASTLGMTRKKAKALMKAYFEGVPFVKPTMEASIAEAQRTGVITTITNRKSRFDLWEKSGWNNKSVPIPYDQAALQYGGNIKRAGTHKALNRRLQGSAADLMKIAMLKCYEDGVFDETGIPRLTVHDELDFSDEGGKTKAFAEMNHILETAVKVNVPIKADGEIGPDWGHVKDLSELTNSERKLYNIN